MAGNVYQLNAFFRSQRLFSYFLSYHWVYQVMIKIHLRVEINNPLKVLVCASIWGIGICRFLIYI